MTPLCCHCAGPPQPGGPCVRSGSQGHQKGRGVISPPALPCYSAVPGHTVALSQPCCARQETLLDSCQASLHPTACTPQPAPHCDGGMAAGTSVCARHPALPGHPSRDTHHGTPTVPASSPRLCPSGTSQCDPTASVQASRHGHASLGMITRPWARPRVPGAATNTTLAMEEGLDPCSALAPQACPPQRGLCLGSSPVTASGPAWCRGSCAGGAVPEGLCRA